jgi:F-type H+-transporting ATPase subunit b
MFDINPGLTVWTTVVFLVLLWVLGKFAWKPLLRSLQEREEGIRISLEQADRARSEAAELLRQNELNRSRAEEEYRAIVREARSLAEKLKEDMVAKAKRQAQREVESAKEEIARNLDAARQQLRGEAADLAVKIAEKLLNEAMDEAKQKNVIDGFLKQLSKN